MKQGKRPETLLSVAQFLTLYVVWSVMLQRLPAVLSRIGIILASPLVSVGYCLMLSNPYPFFFNSRYELLQSLSITVHQKLFMYLVVLDLACEHVFLYVIIIFLIFLEHDQSEHTLTKRTVSSHFRKFHLARFSFRLFLFEIARFLPLCFTPTRYIVLQMENLGVCWKLTGMQFSLFLIENKIASLFRMSLLKMFSVFRKLSKN